MGDRLRVLMTAVVVPTLLMVFVSFGFTTNYTRWVFGESSFRRAFENGVYRYRVVGREGVLATDRLLRKFELSAPRESPADFAGEQVRRYDPVGDPQFYLAYVVWNTLGVVLASVLLALLLRDTRLFHLSEPERSLWVLFSAGVMAVTQYVMTSYDASGYALFVGCAWASLRALVRPTVLSVLTALVLLVIGALNRETAALNVSFVAAVSLQWFGLHRRTLIASALAALAFGATYLGLRLVLGFDHGVMEWFFPLAWTGQVFGRVGVASLACVLLVPLLAPRASLRLWATFVLLSTPYLVLSLGSGVPWEVRLWVPMLLAGVVCATLDPGKPAALTSPARAS